MGNMGRRGRPLWALLVLVVALAGCDRERRTAHLAAVRVVSSMELDARAAQLVMPTLRVVGDTAAMAAQRRGAASGRFSGVWIERGDPRRVATVLADLRRRSPTPLLAAGPMDGGAPIDGATRFPSTTLVARLAPAEDAREMAEIAAREAAAVGIDLGFVALPPTNVDGPLTFVAREPWRIGAGLATVIEAAADEGVMTGLFTLWAEGLGDPLLTWDRSRLEAIEIAILRQALDAGAEAVGTGALRLPALTGDSTPLPLSPAVEAMLRRDLGFGHGLLVADLGPGSPIVALHGQTEAAVRAVQAGADLLVRATDPVAVTAAISAAVRSGRLPPERVDSAAVRVMALKIRANDRRAAAHPDSVAALIGGAPAHATARRLDSIVGEPVLPAARADLRLVTADAEIDSLTAMDTAALRSIDAIMEEALEDSVFTAAALAIGRRGALVRLTAYGNAVDATTTIFDIASLTKVVSTTSAVALLVERGEMELDASVRRYLPEWRGEGKADVTVRHLLTHTSGLPSGLWLFGSARSPEAAVEQALAQRLVREPGSAVEYSDLGMILLAEAAERAAGLPLDRFLARELFAPLGMSRTMFLPPLVLAPEIVPSALTPERDFTLRGVVHDGNAFRLGGVAGHAGLFTTARDLAIFAQTMLNGGTYGTTRILAPETIEAFVTRQREEDTRALGWDTPSDLSSAGRYFSARSFGHTGYTGTSLWIDPELDLFVVLLTNRTFTGASATDILRLRAAVHEAAARGVTDVEVRPRRDARAVS